MTTALIYSDRYLEHDPGPSHPERPERLRAIVRALKGAGLWSCDDIKVVEPVTASIADLELVHDREYIELVERLGMSGDPVDADTPARRNTFDIALLAAGGTMEAGRKVMAGEVENSFALVRPPGHHAGRAFGGGFCYFNNLAVMIASLKRDFGLKRVFVCDLDAHHGNGTQDILYDKADVLYMSIHQDGRTLYPGTGFIDEIGSGQGEGYNVNVPVPPGTSDDEYAGIMREIFVPLTEAFRPELIAASVGMDASEWDPLTRLGLSTSAYGWLIGYIVGQAERLCDGKVVLVLEGGYDLDSLAEGAVNLVRALRGDVPASPPGRPPSVVQELKRRLADYWKL